MKSDTYIAIIKKINIANYLTILMDAWIQAGLRQLSTRPHRLDPPKRIRQQFVIYRSIIFQTVCKAR